MANLLEDTINFGFGVFSYSRDKLEKIVEKLVDIGRVEKKDAHEFMQNLINKGEEQRKEIKKYIKEEVTDALSAAGRITKDDIREIIREELSKLK